MRSNIVSTVESSLPFDLLVVGLHNLFEQLSCKQEVRIWPHINKVGFFISEVRENHSGVALEDFLCFAVNTLFEKQLRKE